MAVLNVTAIVFVCVFVGCFAVSFSAQPFDYFQFVQQWSRGTCYGISSDCIQNLPPFSTIHGLWPSLYSNAVLNCSINGGPTFQLNQLSSKQQADQALSWPSVYRKNPTIGFWGYEYDKYGRCSDNIFVQKDYLEESHKKWQQYELTHLLGPFKIHTGKQYNHYTLARDIAQSTRHNVIIRCKSVNKTNQVLHEVVICLDNARIVNVIACPPSRTTNCKTRQLIDVP